MDGVLQLELPKSDVSGATDGGLSSFVLGPENALIAPPIKGLLDADAAAAESRLFNPLVLVGPAGSGKSQLAQAIVRRWRQVLGPEQTGYFTAADFGREFQSAHKDARLAEWRARLRSMRLVVVEDLENLRPNAVIQQELRAAIDALVGNGAAVIVTAECDLAGLKDLDAGLCDRLAAGLSVRVQRPSRAARRAILQLAAEGRGLALSDKELDRLASREVGAAAQMLGRLTEFESQRLHGLRDESFETSNEQAAARDEKQMKAIIGVVTRYFSVTRSALTGPSRRTSLVRARNITAHLARRLTGLSYAQIGRALGGRDHTTVLHSLRRVADDLDHDPQTQRDVDELDRILRC